MYPGHTNLELSPIIQFFLFYFGDEIMVNQISLNDIIICDEIDCLIQLLVIYSDPTISILT